MLAWCDGRLLGGLLLLTRTQKDVLLDFIWAVKLAQTSAQVRRSNAFSENSPMLNPEPEPRFRFKDLLNLEPEPCVQFSSVRVRTERPNRTCPPLMQSHCALFSTVKGGLVAYIRKYANR